MDKKMKAPNNLPALMKRDGIKPAQLAQAWNVDKADVSQRVNGLVSITSPRRKILLEKFGWTASDIYEPIPHETKTEKDESAPTALTDLGKIFIGVLLHHEWITPDELLESLASLSGHYGDDGMGEAQKVMRELMAYVRRISTQPRSVGVLKKILLVGEKAEDRKNSHS